MHTFEKRTNGILFAGDLLVFALALFLTLAIRYQELPTREVWTTHLTAFGGLFLLWTAIFLIVGLYDQYVNFDRKLIPRLVIRTQVINILLGSVLFFILPLGIAPKTNLIIYLVVSTILVLVWRLFVYPKIASNYTLRALVIGTGPEAEGVIHVLQRNPYFKQVEVHAIDTERYQDVDTIGEALEAYVRENPTDMIIADMNESVAHKLTPVFYNLTFFDQQVRFFSLPEFYEQLHHRIPPSLIHESWVLQHISVRSPHYAYAFLKRLIDIVGAILLLIPCIIIFPIVAYLIRRQDGGPVFYYAPRVGKFNEPFTLIKFRTMTGSDTGDAVLQSELRVTPLGEFLRKTRIDELPQLINVLQGRLSFIGPRPELPALAEVYAREIPYYNMRHLIKPGLSGWAQINNYDVPRGGVDVERTIDKLSFDLYYLRNRSLLLDLEIILKTINTVLGRTGT